MEDVTRERAKPCVKAVYRLLGVAIMLALLLCIMGIVFAAGDDITDNLSYTLTATDPGGDTIVLGVEDHHFQYGMYTLKIEWELAAVSEGD